MSTRTLTVLFTDIVGSTQLFTGIEARQATRLRRGHFEQLGEHIGRWHGRQVKNLGDGVMATFESSRHAIDCAIAIQRATIASDRASAALSVRIGIASGDVEVDDGDCFGPAVVVASRLCSRAVGGQVLIGDSARALIQDRGNLLNIGEVTLKGLDEPTRIWEAPWSVDASGIVRVVLADDAILVREGIAHVLESAGLEVVGQAGDADGLLCLVRDLDPDLAIVDVRMPPTGSDEGLRAAEQIRREHPGTATLVLTQELEPAYAARMMSASDRGVGYLLKERVTDLHAFVAAARRVAAGGTAFEATSAR